MPWTERQQALLRAMGLRIWQPASHGGGVHAPGAVAPAPAAETSRADRSMPAREGSSSSQVAPPVPQSPGSGARAAQPVLPDRAMPRAGQVAATAAASPAAVNSAVPEPEAGAAPVIDATAVANLGWPELREAVAACRGCRLCESRKQTVFGIGHPEAHWMVVGEAPGAQEDDQGEPFVGAAGQLLDAMLRALGLDRAAEGHPAAHVYIANTLKCRPPGNRNPQADELQRCEPYLVRQIQLVRPRLILAMGRFAVQALLRTTEPIGRLRGREHRYQGVPLIVTYHPAYLLRNPPDKARAWEDLCLAAEVMARQAGAADAPGNETREAGGPGEGAQAGAPA